MKVPAAIGGSMNALLPIPAIAHEFGGQIEEEVNRKKGKNVRTGA
jgi:dihydroxyacid dehydratase/phosphogluconate dehydratase